MIWFLAAIAFLFAGWRMWRRLRFFLHLFQLQGYKPHEYVNWVKERAGRVAFRWSHRLAVLVLAVAYFGFFGGDAYWTAIVVLPLWAVLFASSRRYRSDREKKPLKYTPRMLRLLVTASVLALVPVVAGIVVGARIGPAGFFWFLMGLLVADLGGPLWVLVAAFLMQPVEAAIQRGFKRAARRKVAVRPDISVIGITGSYGKTSTKFILKEILQQRYNVLATPSSYNTPMGICLVVNTKLRPEHQVLILEMGMRYRGDIQELCDIVRPNISVVTTVGVAHLESMGSIENIATEKSDLVSYAKPGATAVLNADDDRVLAMRSRANGKVWTVSVEGNEADVTARDIRYNSDGATFTVTDDTGAEESFRTRLLGRHNVLNILLGVAVGREMGLRLRQIAHAVRRLEPVAHRLQLREAGPVTVIDDAFNANPVGARNAVEILGQFDTGRRVIITPGMIELGERQYEENRTFGRHIAPNVDLAVLVGEDQTRPIRDGLADAGFPEEHTRVFGSLFDAQAFLKSYLRAGDVVLYENDLPDQYDEPS